MTVTIAWIRNVGDTEELVLASDSRLRWGQAWDACPKLFRSSRGDTVLGFAGDTMYSYPLIIQATNHISLHRASLTRELDIHDLKGHLERVFNNMLNDISDFPTNSTTYESPESLFVMAGYSWRYRKFALWKVRYDNTQKKFVWESAGGIRSIGGPNKIVILGHPSMSMKERKAKIRKNQVPEIPEEQDIKIITFSRLAKLIKQAGGLSGCGLDMQPFQVLCDMLRENVSPHIGGAPQLVKIYPSCNSTTFGVLWPNAKSKTVFVSGRRLLNYEKFDCPVIDPDTLEIGMNLWPKKIKGEL